jgi:predicted nucleic acid-binding protein
MTTESSDSGLDELMRLSQQFNNEQREATEREKQNARQKQNSQDVLSELRAFSISMAVGQLKLVATPEMVERVNALQSKQGTDELRKLIHNLIYELEKQISIIVAANPDIKPVEQLSKTLAILVGLLFSLTN